MKKIFFILIVLCYDNTVLRKLSASHGFPVGTDKAFADRGKVCFYCPSAFWEAAGKRGKPF
jgi:hypothetical protein